MRRPRPDLPLLAVAATFALAGAAAAQTSATGPAGAAGPPSREARRADWQARRQAHEVREVADLSTVLRLRPEQQAGLRAWLDAGRPAPGERRGERMGAAGDASPPTTAQTLDREAARMTEHEGRMRARLDATRRFYASLGPDQQAVFDALQRLRHGHGHGGGGHRGMDGEGMRMGWRGAGAPPPTGD